MAKNSQMPASYCLGYALGQLEDKAIERKLYDLGKNDWDKSMEVRIETKMITTDSKSINQASIQDHIFKEFIPVKEPNNSESGGINDGTSSDGVLDIVPKMQP